MTVKALLTEVQNAARIATQYRHRFMVMLCCPELEGRIFKLARRIFHSYREVAGNRDVLIVGRSKFLEMAKEYFNGKLIHYKESPSILGETYPSLLLDLTEGFHPNDLGIIVETIAEGGMIVSISPYPKSWERLVGKWHKELISDPYTVNDVTPRFYRRFIKRTFKAEGIIIFDAKKREFIKRYECRKGDESQRRGEIYIPETKEIKKKLYKLCATQDQVRVLQLFEKFFERKRERKSIVITADRGRGKTAVLGIVTPYLISRMHRVLRRPIRIMIVAPTPYAVQTYFQFLKKSLIRQGMKEYKVKESNGLITVLNSRFARVEYVVPRRAIIEKEYADIIVVDEAAGIDVPVLWEITKGVRYAIFSTTIHGYEGSGRGFSIRFLKKLENDRTVEIERIHLDEPIRYGSSDPIEAWLYDVLLLDAQPAELNEKDIEAIKDGRLTFELIDKDAMFSDDRLLREFFGIYVLAHYRNRPSDVVILADMPNHLPFRVVANGKTVCSIHIAVEGGLGEEIVNEMAEGYKPRGHIIPDLVLKHYWNYDFPMFSGVRVVRIATHPSVMSMGIGSFGLRELVGWATKNEMAWVGSGFGVSPELLRFWIRNGFSPIHITPQRSEISGEHTIIVLKALKMQMHVVESLNSKFVRRVLEWLNDELSDLENETAVQLLHSLLRDANVRRPSIDDVDRKRLKKYFQGLSLYEYVSDIARPLTKYFYSRTNRTELDEDEEKILIAKCLQLRPWWKIDKTPEGTVPFKVLVKTLKKVWKWYDGKT